MESKQKSTLKIYEFDSNGQIISESFYPDLNLNSIDAFPQLYEALESMVKNYQRLIINAGEEVTEQNEPEYFAALAALKKAKGE